MQKQTVDIRELKIAALEILRNFLKIENTLLENEVSIGFKIRLEDDSSPNG